MSDQPADANNVRRRSKSPLKKKPVDNSAANIVALDEQDIQIMKLYRRGPFTERIQRLEAAIESELKHVNKLCGVQEDDTGLAPSALWDLANDRRIVAFELPMKVGIVENIYPAAKSKNDFLDEFGEIKQTSYLVKCYSRQIVEADFGVFGIERGMRVAVWPTTTAKIGFPLPPAVDPIVALMEIEEKPDITYADIGGCKEEIEKLREVLEFPLLNPERFTNLGIDPPKGVLLYGPPGTGKTLCARAVANRTNACFIRINGSELIRKYVGEGPKVVRDLFKFARSKPACIIFFDEVDAFGATRQLDDGEGSMNEVQRTMLELITQLDGFDPRGNIKVLMATNRPDTLDAALVRPGRIDRKIEFSPPDVTGRMNIFKIHAGRMSVEPGIRYELLARLCQNVTGADIRSICTEAGMFAIRARRKMAIEKDFLDGINKVVKGNAKFNATPSYMTHN